MSPSPEKSLDELTGLAAVQQLLAPLVEAFTSDGFSLYLVGGVVRDLLNGQYGARSDLDLTTEAEPEHIKRLVRPLAKAVWTQGERFGTIGVQIADVASPTGVREVEITTHRAEKYSPESRNPEVAFGTDLRQDLSRRDFTVNAMAIELVGWDRSELDGRGSEGRAELRDPFDGYGDLQRRVLRTPLGPEISFEDDPLRMMRAARFMARLELQPVTELEAAAAGMAGRLAIVSVERIADELERLLAVDDPTQGLDFLEQTGLLAQVLAVPYEADTAVNLASGDGPAEIRRAGLLAAVEDPAQVLSRLRYSNDDRRSTVAVIDALRTWLDSERDLEATRRAVHMVTAAKGSHRDLAGLAQLYGSADHLPDALELVVSLDQLEAANDLGPYVSPLSGPDVMEALAVEPGPVVGRAQKFLVEHRLQNGPISDAAARRLLIEHHVELLDD